MEDPRWLDGEEQRAWRSYIEATMRAMRACNSELEAETGLTDDDYGVLMFLSEAPQRSARMVDLAGFLGTSPSRITYRIDRLVAMGYVRRQSCPTDKRGSFAVLTPEGMRAMEHAAPIHVASVRRHLLDHISREELLTLGRILEPVAEAHRDSRGAAEEELPA